MILETILQCQCSGLGDHVLIDGDILATLFPIAGALHAPKWAFRSRRVSYKYELGLTVILGI